MKKILFFVLTGLGLASCAYKDGTESQIMTDEPNAPFLPGTETGKITDREMNEISGIELSVKNPGILWMHNDSGAEPVLFAADEKGRLKHRIFLSGAESEDWEDIAVGSGPEDSLSYLFIGDFGDNEAVREVKTVYRFPEPDLSGKPAEFKLSSAEKIKFVFEDGSRDAESMFIDPWTKDLIIISKRELNIGVYVLPFPQMTGETLTARKIATLPVTQAVAADITPDGQELILKNYNAVFYWRREKGEDLAQMFAEPPVQLPYVPELQGESMCWNADASAYLTTTEMRDESSAIIFTYFRKK